MTATERPELVAGVKWPEIQMPGDIFLHDEDQPWVDMEGFPGSQVKVLYADQESNTVAFLYKLQPHSSFAIHEHICRAFAYTLEGEWWYGDTYQKKGSMAIEVPGSTHFPVTKETGFTVLAILAGEPGGTVLLRSQDPETLEVAELGAEFFASLMK
ncbi:MAG: hypothetical protein GEV09_06585 [Pseudonocardiaceae bacterium]|nr:hypothetical protein [Pseudonocardiaceae bacterium]